MLLKSTELQPKKNQRKFTTAPQITTTISSLYS
jgi:hypothetical protein